MIFPGLRSSKLEKRIVVFFVVLLLFVQMAGFFAIRYAIEQSARSNLREELSVGVRVFKRLLEQNSQQLVEATAVLTYDFGFREAVSSQDSGTILSALTNHRDRIKAAGMALVNLQNVVVADTLQADAMGKQFAFPELIAGAADRRRSSAIRMVDGTVCQIVVVPVLAPLPISWVAMSFVIDDAVASDLKRITSLDVTFIGKTGNAQAEIVATTLSASAREQIGSLTESLSNQPEMGGTRILGDEEFEVLTTTIDRYDNKRIFALLQRSMRDGLHPYDSLQVVLLFLAAIGLGISLFGSVRIARRISRPVSALAAAARQVAGGNYVGVAPEVKRQDDEIGELATAFDNMSRGLAERDRIRDLLGKVASPEVAEQLLRQNIELGGEERQVTVMFTDIRDFTELCETMSPHSSLTLLNRYLERISGVIDRYEGVIDKYTGDGVMALFGAPVARVDDPERAMLAALEINRQVLALGEELARERLPNPLVGIGINTSRVIAGNIGTASRLNYTVLGDGVNLAARFESLTKRYRVPIVVGRDTCEKVPSLIYRELDKVRVKGKKVAVRIFEPMGRESELDADTLKTLESYHKALEAFRHRRWPQAKDTFVVLEKIKGYQRICEIYLAYIAQFETLPPDHTWDGSFALYEK
ncbi:MAG: adenylate/guanylate cyclase domain-containing protein [Betaproteobacteria bacterium]